MSQLENKLTNKCQLIWRPYNLLNAVCHFRAVVKYSGHDVLAPSLVGYKPINPHIPIYSTKSPNFWASHEPESFALLSRCLISDSFHWPCGFSVIKCQFGLSCLWTGWPVTCHVYWRGDQWPVSSDKWPTWYIPHTSLNIMDSIGFSVRSHCLI